MSSLQNTLRDLPALTLPIDKVSQYVYLTNHITTILGAEYSFCCEDNNDQSYWVSDDQVFLILSWPNGKFYLDTEGDIPDSAKPLLKKVAAFCEQNKWVQVPELATAPQAMDIRT